MPQRVKPEISAADVADRLHSAAIRLLRRLRQADDAAGLTGPQSSALSVLVFGGPTTLSRLAEAEHVRAPTMSRLAKELEAKGLIARRTDAADRRSAVITATAKGRALLAKARALRLGLLETALAARSAEQRRLLGEAATIVLEMAEGGELT
jgi:DNA-binding MarR family transcriptional regulator